MALTLSANDLAALKAGQPVSLKVNNLASVKLVAPLYEGIGGICDPYFWEDARPMPGETVYYDNTDIIVTADGEISSARNNVSAPVFFFDAHGNIANGLIAFTSGEVAYASARATARGTLR